MAAAVFAFVLFNLWYGVIPHQWITLADKEWGWRKDRILFGPFDLLQPHRFLPFTMSTGRPAPDWVIRLYLRLWPVWPLFGRQFLVVARRRIER